MPKTLKNSIPETVENIHLIAVCGTAMGALAAMLKEMGYGVTGSDQNVYPPMSDFLARKQVDVFEGYNPDHLACRPDLVIVGNAVSRENPEAVRMTELGLPYCSMPQAVNHFVAAGKKQIVVTGTHGKTTTSSLISHILHCAGSDPSFLIGGIVSDFDSNYRKGEGPHMVIEGDEYDTAYFDKGPKFLHYTPAATVLTSIEFDHADIYDSLEGIKASFSKLMENLPAGAPLFAFDGDENIRTVADAVGRSPVFYGKAPQSAWQLKNASVHPPETLFDVYRHGQLFGSFRTPLMGEHNLLNALAAIAVADFFSIPTEAVARALSSFKGPRRRQEVRGAKNGVTVIDDFAHHPTAVRETIRGVKPFYPAGRLIAVFEPRTNTSMRKVFQQRYAESFDDADMICIRKPPLLSKIPEGERFSSESLVEDLNKRGMEARYFPDTESIIAFLVQTAVSGDVVLIMSNGGFDNIHQRLLDAL